MNTPNPSHEFSVPDNALEGRLIAISGATGAIGRALALSAAAHGAQVLLLGRNVRKLEGLHAEIGALKRAEALIAQFDLEHALARDYDQIADALQQRFGHLDGLVHAAALLGAPAPIEHYDVPTWVRVVHVNLTAAFALTQVLLPLLRHAADASIIFSSCSAGRSGEPYAGAYGASKFALEGLAQTLALELPDDGSARVNCVDPGPVRSALRTQAFPAEDASTLRAPTEAVAPYLWLLSAAARGVSGQHLSAVAAAR